MARMQQEHQKLDARREASSAMAKMPYRFWVPPQESKEIVIVDEGITFARNEHACKNPRTSRFDLFLPCIAEHANCPVCSAHPDKQPYFAAFLTVLDLSEYEDKETHETVYFSKRLLEIKPMQQKKFMRLQQQHGSLRGMVLTMTRDSKKDARIGNDIEFNSEILSEDDLEQYTRTYVDRQDKEQTVIGYEPFDYEELFPDMSEEQLRAICNGAPEPGSRAFERDELDPETGDGFSDDEAAAPVRRPARGSAQAPAGRSATPQRAGTRPARREVEEAEQEEAPAPRGQRTPPAVAGSRAAVRGALRRTPAAEEQEPEDTPPARSIAGARAALRRPR